VHETELYMLKIKKISEVVGKQVYTSEGDYFGQIEEVNLVDNKIEGWRIRIGSSFANVLGGARGVIIPHQFVKAIGDVFIINKGSLPSSGSEPMAVSSGTESSSEVSLV
jgi:sporulation protein YlmC with PRC-barrel domain